MGVKRQWSDIPTSDKTCLLCERQHHANGYCKSHDQTAKEHRAKTGRHPAAVYEAKRHLGCEFPQCGSTVSIFQFTETTLKVCQAHYKQWIRLPLGERSLDQLNPLEMSRNPCSLEEALLRKTRKTKGCWHWIGFAYTNPRRPYAKPYGRFKRPESGSNLAHRIAYEVWVGEIPEGMDIHHKCANTLCVKPDHLQLATKAENSLDMLARRSYESQIKALQKRIQGLEEAAA
jgi:hypothetical protein